MGTRGYIAKQIDQDAYLTIYCHLDSYPEQTGDLLLKHYQDPEKVEKLLGLGDIWCLEKDLDPNPTVAHDLMQRQKDVIFAFGRDGGQEGCEAAVMTLAELNDLNTSIHFVYVFTPENSWKYFVPGQAVLGFRDIQADLEHPESIPAREHPLFQKLQAEVLGKLGQNPPDQTEEPEQGQEMKMT